MSRLPLVDPSQAQGKAHELFEAIKGNMGRVPNMMKAMANSTAVLEGYLALSGSRWGPARSTRRSGSGSRSRSPRPTAAATAWRRTPCWGSSPGSTSPNGDPPAWASPPTRRPMLPSSSPAPCSTAGAT